jgi:hypothetical protein
MKSIKSILILALLTATALTGCARISREEDRAPDVDMTIVFEPTPPEVGPATLIVTMTDAQGTPIDDAHLQVKGDMSHAGMQPVLAEVEDGTNGRYETPFEWTMAGDWILTLTATLPDGRTAARQFDLTVEGDMADMHMHSMPGEHQK